MKLHEGSGALKAAQAYPHKELQKSCRPEPRQRLPRSLPALLELIGLDPAFCWSKGSLRIQHRLADAARARSGNIWKRIDDAEIDIQDLAWEAHRAYRRRMKTLHPNAGGRAGQARRVLAAWAKVRVILRRRGAVV